MINEKEGSSFEHFIDAQGELEAILSTPLTPESIDTYASDALDRIILLIRKTVNSYTHEPTIHYLSQKELEEAALRYYDVQDIETILDYVADKDEDIKSFDALIAEATNTDEIILPPADIARPMIIDCETPFEVKRHIPRVKTTLFILKSLYDVKVEPEDILKGKVTKSMMRRESYYAIDVDTLSRTILVCDEEGNASYVLDSEAMSSIGVTSKELLKLDKLELNDFIREHPELGQSFIYSKSFVSKMINAIEHPQDLGSPNHSIKPDAISLLKPPTDDEFLSVFSMTPEMNVNYRTLMKVVAELHPTLADARPFRHSRGLSYEYSKKDRQAIREYLQEHNYYAQSAPETILPVKGIAEKYGVSNSSVLKALEDLGDTIGHVETYRFGDKPAKGYEPEQQDLIAVKLDEMELLVEKAPDHIAPLVHVASELNVSPDTVKKIQATFTDLGEIRKYKFGSRITDGYTKVQVETMRKYLHEQGYYTEAPEGYLPTTEIARMLKVDPRRVKFAIESLNESLGEGLRCRFGGMATICYSPEQQLTIKEFLSNK
jgi:Mn-dependent DtxR family transcriptional regulator